MKSNPKSAPCRVASEQTLLECGGSQSPVDIVLDETVRAELPPIEVDYGQEPLRIRNDGRSVFVDCAGGNRLSHGDDRYALIELHFHVPSEHLVDGQPAAAELHLVHRRDDGLLAVLGLMVVEGDSTPTGLVTFLEHAPATPGDTEDVAGVSLDMKSLLPSDLSYFAYDGSKTMEPLHEGVRWFVLQRPATMTAGDLRRLRALYDGNIRAVQPINARWVLRAGESGQ